MNKIILVTGGAGFVGSNLSIKLKADYPSSRVIALDNLKRRGSELNIPRLRSHNVEFIHGDIRNKEDIEQIGQFDLMIECSAEPSVLAGYSESPAYLINTNLVGTINCLEAVRKHKADIVFLSTSRVYPVDALNHLPYDERETRFDLTKKSKTTGVSVEGISESFTLNGPRSLYGATKLASEILLTEYVDMYGIHGIINRCGVLTGPWQMGKVDQGFVVLWIAKHIFNGHLSYLGYGGMGKQVRDILHIDDLYNLLVLQIGQLNELSGQIYNVGGGKKLSVSLCELTELCRKITGNQIKIDSVRENRNADIPYYISDCRKISNRVGWQPTISLDQIVAEITDWIKESEQLLKPILN